ncbi:MAG: SLOG family protein [Firmicutes bacterium]|nr:SLOG family protein [Bacillota bacterium]MDY5531606.1 SLOG family protein [Pumilibacteraceae bacterium]
MEKTCAFTGNRPEKLPWQYNESDPRCVRAKQEIANRVREAVRDGYVRFISGMAQGGDVFFAESVLALKDENPSVTLECAVPYLGQASRWSGEYRLRYDDILKRADKITVLSDDYTPWCMHVRNRYMVDNCSRLITLDYGKSGGTQYTIEYAKSKNKEIVDVFCVKFEIYP